MPKRSAASRSLFSALPPDLKKSIRSQVFVPLPSLQDGEVLADVERDIRQPAATDLLATQPRSPSISSTASQHDLPIASSSRQTLSLNQAMPPSITTQQYVVSDLAKSSKRKFAHIAAPDAYTQLVEPTTSSSRKLNKVNGKRRKSIRNPYVDHPWDCSGLVPRFSKPSDVPPDLIKYWYQRKSLFPLYDELPLLLDTTGWFSITPQAIAAQIADRCTCDVILDAFCGVGGNAIEFARTCERVIAMDNDPIRLRLARHNALHHGVADRIEFILGDYVEFAKAQASRSKVEQSHRGEEIDVVFLSPPWGGPDYLNFKTPLKSTSSESESKPSSYSLSSILPIHGKQLFDLTSLITPNIAYFLPRNVDVEEIGALAPLLKATPEMFEGKEPSREWVEIEEEWVGDKLKAVTAYFGSLCDLS